MNKPYNHHEIETKWQKYWEEHETFKTDVWDFSKPKFYALDMFGHILVPNSFGKAVISDSGGGLVYISTFFQVINKFVIKIFYVQ